MGLSAGALLVLGAGFHWIFFAEGIVWLFVGSPVFVVGGLLYGRLLGRLAYVLAFTKPFLARKKKKKRKPAPQPKEDADTEERFEQPSELPPIESPDEGPLTGYDVKFDDPPRRDPDDDRRPRQRVLAEVADDPDDADEPPPRPSRAIDDEDEAPYDVHEPEVQPEERAPSPVVKPREDEMRLLNRDDAPKPPTRAWSAELFSFLGQPGTIGVITVLSGMCLVVGGMVRLAREFNPATGAE
jgi:hypothetical protein